MNFVKVKSGMKAGTELEIVCSGSGRVSMETIRIWRAAGINVKLTRVKGGYKVQVQ